MLKLSNVIFQIWFQNQRRKEKAEQKRHAKLSNQAPHTHPLQPSQTPQIHSTNTSPPPQTHSAQTSQTTPHLPS